ncbi:carboxypeptidase N regulatory subunit [Sarotherodon galilaeus]
MGPIHVMMWINIGVCLPLTILVICCLCCVVRREQVSITYYTNLLISNLIQFSMMIISLIIKENHELVLFYYISLGIYYCAVFANLDFKMCIATERCLVITRPQWNWIRQTKCYGPESVDSVFFLPTEEKQRIVGILVLLLVNHCLTFLPLIIFYVVPISLYFLIPIFLILINLFLFSPFMDVILFFLMWKDPIDNQLLSLCCYTGGEVAADKKLQLHCCSDCNSTVLYTTLQQM